ncbi:exosortase B [Massilia sp. METH4]|uniref:exosortase B n=1 Tax=Massilia sp. METH4 TaxID=3123041 RepID=UPI0030D60FBF
MAAPLVPWTVSPAQTFRAALPSWWPILLGMALLFVPTLYTLLTGIWSTEEQAHGPIILVLSIWLSFRLWPSVQALPAYTGKSVLGWVLTVAALLLYILGRSQAITAFEILGCIMLLMGVLLIKRGPAALRTLWFPFFFMMFMIPLPGPVVSMLTMPMKMAVSHVTEHILYAAGLPIARSGVILQVGQYQLLVADACAGLQTLLTLESLGLFYLNLVRHPSAFRNLALAILIIPISFTANVIRVTVLCLITYFMGDAAGQGFLHGFAGMVLFITALVLTIAADSALQWYVRRKERQTPAAEVRKIA